MTNWYLSPKAEDDLKDIWISTAERWSERQADAYIADLSAAFDRLAVFPNSARDASEIMAGYRALPVGGHTAYFVSDRRGILIVRVLHQRMDPDSQF